MTKNKEIAVIEKELNPMIAKATKLSIEDAKDMRTSAEMLSQLNLARDKVTERMETITKPAKETIKAAEAIWKPFVMMAKEAIEVIRSKQSAYQTEQVRLAREEEEKIAARQREGRGGLKFETAVRKIEEIERPDEYIVVASGSLKFREMKKLKITDSSVIPDKFWIIDETMVTNALKGGENVPGAELESVQIPVNSK